MKRKFVSAETLLDSNNHHLIRKLHNRRFNHKLTTQRDKARRLFMQKLQAEGKSVYSPSDLRTVTDLLLARLNE